MRYIIKQASQYTADEKAQLGITGIPDAWPVEMYQYWGGAIPVGFHEISDDDLAILKANNQAAYDSWVATIKIETIVQDEPKLVTLSSPAAPDLKPYTQSSPRPIGTYTVFTSRGDTDTGYGDGQAFNLFHRVGDPLIQSIYLDFNTVENPTWLCGSYASWCNAVGDEIVCEIVPKVSTFAAGTNTNFMSISGVLVMVPAGGNLAVDFTQAVPVEMPVNEFRTRPPGYWECTWNKTTRKFENFQFKPDGSGRYNIFTQEVILNRFVPSQIMCGTHSMELKSSDVTSAGHNMRLKATFYTRNEDHEWHFAANLSIFRNRTL